ncbi:MAG: hybrid sensor histidine kinase/response regulator [Candidatus Electrothrix sp. AW5]|nr:hybrid sensor histidine kinase/response regulator [Candidatus Electrothrix gigas]
MQKILIVDDKEQNLFTLRKVLDDLDVEFVQATSGNDALKATLHNDFALAILDVQMPDIDGYELAELLRCDAKTENLPIIFLSAVYHDDYHVFKGYESGAVDFISKPYEPKILLSKVYFFLQLHQQKIALEKAVELEKTKNHLENILFSMTDAVFVINLQGQIEICNQGSQSLVGYEPAEIVGQSLHAFLAEEDCKNWIQQFMSAQNVVPLHNRETLLRTANDEKIPVLASASPVCHESGDAQGAVFVLRDLRDRKKLEEQIVRSKRMESIGLIAGGVAHDLNNILAGIIGYPELLLKTLPDNSDLRESLEAILESGQRAAMVVADLLTVARGVAVAKERYDLNILVEEYLASPEQNKLYALYPDIRYEYHMAATHADIFCSPLHIKKCLINLVTNAAEAVVDSGTIRIATHNTFLNKEEALEHGIVAAQEYVVLCVEDTGSGISEEDLQHIFEPFYTKKVMGRSGTGLGLAVVWNTVQDHKSKISVISDEQGTKFHIYFPLTKKEATASEENREEEIAQQTGTILVIDDEPQLRDLAIKMLDSLGYTVDAVCSGELAIKYLLEKTVDLIIIDMQMEMGMNGYETYREIIKIYPEQKALIVTGFSDSKDVKAALQLGANGFIKKPYSIEQLGQAVQNILSKKK